MSKYKVGDIAALFSKPKEPTTQAGKKLQALFKEFHGDNKSFKSQERSPKQYDKSQIKTEENGDQKASKSKKRKFSATFSQESNLNENLEGVVSQEASFRNKNKKNKNFSEDKDFPRKKKKLSKLNSFNVNSYNNSEINESPEKGIPLTNNSKLNFSPKGKKVKSGFIKKSKGRAYDMSDSFTEGQSKISNKDAEAFDSNEESLKEEIKTFLKSNSKKSKKKNWINTDLESSPPINSNKNCSVFVKNSKNNYTSETTSTLKTSSNDKIQETGFIRRPKNRNKAINNNFERDDNEESESFNGKIFDNNDTSFKRENDTKKFKTKFTDFYNSRKSSFKSEPEFAKLLVKNPEDEADKLSRTLFVGNLSVTTRLNELKNLFSPFGEIEFIKFKGIETDKAKIFGENASKKLNSNYAADSVPGFIIFKERESAVKALTLCGTVFKKHHITVDFAMPSGSKKIYDAKRSIFIGNLPFDVKDESIWNAFSDCGKIEGVRVVRDKETGIGKGFGYVLFCNEESRKNALSLDNLEIEGRLIRIKAVDSNKKTQKESGTPPVKRDTFKSRAIKFKNKNRNANVNSRKSIKKLVKKEKTQHKKKKIASLLLKSKK